MKKLIAIVFASLLMNGAAAYAEPGPVRAANCKDIIDGIKKKANAQPGQPGQPGAQPGAQPAAGEAR